MYPSTALRLHKYLLEKAGVLLTEDDIVNYIESPQADPHRIPNAVAYLAVVGRSPRTINKLLELLNSNDTDVSQYALAAYSAIRQERGTEFYRDALRNKNFPNRWMIPIAVDRYAEGGVSVDLKRYLQDELSSRNEEVDILDGHSGVTASINYLSRQNPEAYEDALRIIKEHEELLDSREKTWLQEHGHLHTAK